MSFRNKGLVLAMEELEEVLPAEPVEMVPETQAQVETAAGELEEHVDGVEEVVEATGDAEADATALTDVHDIMEESVEKGEGLDETSAEIAEVAVESICARLGIRTQRKAMPAMESFGNKSSRLTATKIAMESVMDKVKQVWTAILNAIKMVWEKIKGFFAGLLKHRGLLLKHLESLQKRVETLTAEHKAGDAKLTGGIAKAFSIDGKADYATATAIVETAGKLMGVIGACSGVAARQAASMLKASVEGDASEVSLVETFYKDVAKSVATLGSAGEGKDGAKHFGNLVGGRTIAVLEKTEGDKFLFNLSLVDGGKDAAKEIEVLDKTKMLELIKKAIVLVKDLQQAEKIEKELANVSKACNETTQSILKGASKLTEDKDEAANMNKAAVTIRQLNSTVAKFGSSLPGAVFQAAKSAGDYVSASAGAHKVPKAAETK